MVRPGPKRLLALLLLGAAVSCEAVPAPRGAPASRAPGPPANFLGGVPIEHVPAIEAIRVALAEGANETARGILRSLMARGIEGVTLELARGFERILDGRERVAWVDLRLEALADPEHPAVFRLELVVSQHGPEELVYRPGGAQLWVYQAALGPDGSGQRGSRRDAVPFSAEILIPREGEARYEVAQLSLAPPPGILAFSSKLRLELSPGEFLLANGGYLPAQSMFQPELELVRLAGALPNEALEPEELVRYVRAGKLYLPALLERAVRITPERRQEALDQLTPLVAHLTGADMQLLVPALRWLAQTDQPGGDPEAWRRYMARRGAARGRPASASSDALVLPRSAVRATRDGR